jgi:hypothetical protein
MQSTCLCKKLQVITHIEEEEKDDDDDCSTHTDVSKFHKIILINETKAFSEHVNVLRSIP